MGVMEHLARFVCRPDAAPKMMSISLIVVASCVVGGDEQDHIVGIEALALELNLRRSHPPEHAVS